MAVALAERCADRDEVRAMGDRVMAQVVSEAMALKDGMVEADGGMFACPHVQAYRSIYDEVEAAYPDDQGLK